MTIAESQLETWASIGAQVTSASTYGTIKNALESPGANYAGKQFEVFLQGSYGNDTNIYRESDVDVVIQLNSAFRHDLSRMPQDQQELFRSSFATSDYLYEKYREDVIEALEVAFGSDVEPGKKAIKIKPRGSRRSADVVPAMQFRRYRRFQGLGSQDYTPGIYFQGESAEGIENYPKEHSKNLTTKHQATGQMFKPFARILKNMRTRLVDAGTIPADLAPSYFIEGLLFNVPNSEFKSNYQDTFISSMNWLLAAEKKDFVCANWQFFLLRGDSAVTWTPEKCQAFINAIIKKWNDGTV